MRDCLILIRFYLLNLQDGERRNFIMRNREFVDFLFGQVRENVQEYELSRLVFANMEEVMRAD